jgi:hypothetical protein
VKVLKNNVECMNDTMSLITIFSGTVLSVQCVGLLAKKADIILIIVMNQLVKSQSAHNI